MSLPTGRIAGVHRPDFICISRIFAARQKVFIDFINILNGYIINVIV